MGLVVDNFAGGGGASTGIENALGRPCDIAVNHSAEAIRMHMTNHPQTEHYLCDVWEVDPQTATQGQPVDLAWFSPDCRHFSKAKGGKPVSDRIRGLAWVVVKWAKAVKPAVIMMENVEEFATWGPLDDDGYPIRDQSGETFAEWIEELESLGYEVQYRELVAADYGAPTSRKRLFLIARCDGAPIVWPDITHTPENYRTAAECIDWKIPTPSIFERKRPLAEKTHHRIAAGLRRYVLDSPQPFLVTVGHGPSQDHTESLNAAPFFVPRYGERPTQAPRTIPATEPMKTIVPTGNQGSLVAAWMAQHNGGMVGHHLDRPLSTLTGKCSHQQLVAAFLLKYYGTATAQDIGTPLHTITSKDRFGLVTAHGRQYQIVDIGMRMLASHELYKAQGFPEDYKIREDTKGRRFTKTSQMKLCGNSVPPPVAEALVRANFQQPEEMAA